MKHLKLLLSFLLLFIFSNCSNSQPDMGLEKIDPGSGDFNGLIKWGSGYSITADSVTRHSGRYSMRIEPANLADRKFGCGVFKIPVNFEGSTIELSGYMKMENVENGSAGLFMRIDGNSGVTQMDNMLNRQISGTSDWQRYSITLPVSKYDNYIYFGGILNGTGTIWLDDFSILIDGKDISGTKHKSEPNRDTAFDNGSKIVIDKLNKSNIEDLVLLGKLWGFLKYYHPVVVQGNINWDYELFRVMGKVINCNSKDERNKILTEWVSAVGLPEVEKLADISANSKIKMPPDLKWTEDKSELGIDLVNQLQKIKTLEKSVNNTFVNFFPTGNPVLEYEQPYGNMIYPDEGFRLLALYRYWNIIQYLFPYKYLIRDNWDDVLKDFIPEFVKCKDSLEYRLTILKLLAKVSDTHGVIPGDQILEKYIGVLYPPFTVSFIDDMAVITNLFDDNTTSELKKGDIIEKINGEDVSKIKERVLPYYNASNHPAKLRSIARDIFRSNNEFIDITYTSNSKKNTCKIKLIDRNTYYKYAFIDKDAWKILDNNTGYLYPAKLKNSELPEIMSRMKNCKGLIIDFRCYPADFIVFSLSEYLMPKSIEFVKFTRTSSNQPGLFTFSEPFKVGRENPDYFTGKVIILVNETTQSSAEYTVMGLRKAPEAIVLGSTTAGADGNVSYFSLPGGIRTLITGIGVYYPDGSETQGCGIIPDIEIKPTVKGIAEDRDELIEKAIEIINSK